MFDSLTSILYEREFLVSDERFLCLTITQRRIKEKQAFFYTWKQSGNIKFVEYGNFRATKYFLPDA